MNDLDRNAQLMEWFKGSIPDDATIETTLEASTQDFALNLINQWVLTAQRQPLLTQRLLINALYLGIWLAEFGKTTLIREEKETRAQ